MRPSQFIYAVSIKTAEEQNQTPDWLGVVAADTLEQLSEKVGEILDGLNIKHGKIRHYLSFEDIKKLCFDIDNDTILVFAGWEWAK